MKTNVGSIKNKGSKLKLNNVPDYIFYQFDNLITSVLNLFAGNKTIISDMGSVNLFLNNFQIQYMFGPSRNHLHKSVMAFLCFYVI